MARFAIIEAPSILGLKPTGVETLPRALIEAGLGERLQARWAERVEPSAPYRPERDEATLTLNAGAIVSYSSRLADAVGRVLDAGELPIILGGDCSILLGSALALRRRGRYGLLFIDGHADFYQPEANPNGEAASMELAFATGRGPEMLAAIEGRRPLLRDDDVVVFGYRDLEEQQAYGSQALPVAMLAFDLAEIRRRGIDAVARDAVHHLTRPDGPRAGFFIHLDADAVDDALMPAVDYRLPGGLGWEELHAVLHCAVRSGALVGLEITIYNPALDPDGSTGRALAATVGDALRSPAGAPGRAT